MNAIWTATKSTRPATLTIALNGTAVTMAQTGRRPRTVWEPDAERALATYEHWCRNVVREWNPMGWVRV